MKQNIKVKVLLFAMILLSTLALKAQDSLVFHNGNYIVGEVKDMSRGVLTVETDYSDDDFKIEWNSIKEIYTTSYFLITLSDGSRYNGHFNTTEIGKIEILSDDGQTINANHDDLVWLDDINKGFWSKLDASIDVGFDLTKANNFKQFSTRIGIAYTEKRWNTSANYNTLFSVQDNTDDIKRIDGGIGYRYFLPKDWYPLINLNFLSSTEQSLKLRSSGRIGIGKYMIHTNRSYWGISAGTNYNDETYLPPNDTIAAAPRKSSMEGFLGSELNLFDIGDLNLKNTIVAYPSFTESGRWRVDLDFDAKYEMPFDDSFYIKAGFSINYDNQPVEGASDMDYVIHTGFGWEL